MRAWRPSANWDKYVAHKADVCESENLACVQMPPLTYTHRNPDMHSVGKLSTFQYETVGYACQSLLQNGAFLIGDATGSGKSRVIAGVIKELSPPSVVWISINGRLKEDAQNELECIEAPFTFDTRGNYRFVSYAALHNNDRFAYLLRLLELPHSVLVLDEAHCCRNESATFALTHRLTRVASYVLYSTATVASSLRHMRYLERLQIWGEGTPFASFEDFVWQLRAHGNVVLELLSSQLKLAGKAVSRQISFCGIQVSIYNARLTPSESTLYDTCVDLISHTNMQFFQKLITRFKTHHVVTLARAALARDASVVISLQSTGVAASRRGIDACVEMLHGTILDHLPGEPLDVLRSEFADVGVAEVSGRTSRESKNEVGRFQRGEARVALITRAGATGISLHDTHGAQRLHILMELPWSSEDFLQSAGRTHRTGQLSQPSYVVVTSSVPGEARFVNCVAQRVASLGALTYGDRGGVHISPLSLHTIQDWGIPARRIAALEMWVRAVQSEGIVAEPLPVEVATMVPIAPRTAEIFAFHQIALQTNTDPSHLNYPLTKGQLVTLVRRACPTALTWQPNAWSRERHAVFCTATRRCVETLLVAATRVECASTLGALPAPLLDEIIRHYAADPLNLNERASATLQRLDNLGMSFARFCNTSCEYLQNRILSLPLDNQQVCINTILCATREQRVWDDSRIQTFVKYIAREGIRFVCAGIRRVSLQSDGDAVVLDMKAEAIIYPDPGPLPVMNDSILNSVCKVNVGPDQVRIYYASGKVMSYDRPQWNYVQQHGRFVVGMDGAWDQSTQKAYASRKSRATRATRCHVIAVRDCLRHWEASQRVVVRVQDNLVPGWPSFVGVLM